jgi:hypothetical protein
MIKYNQSERQFEMVGIYSNWSLKQFDILVPDGPGNKFRIVNSKAIPTDTRREATMNFKSCDEYEWPGNNYNLIKGTSTIYTERGSRIK